MSEISKRVSGLFLVLLVWLLWGGCTQDRVEIVNRSPPPPSPSEVSTIIPPTPFLTPSPTDEPGVLDDPDLFPIAESYERSPYHAHITTDRKNLIVAPLKPITITLHLEDQYRGPGEIQLYDINAAFVTSMTVVLEQETTPIALMPQGYPGPQSILLLIEGRIAAIAHPIWTLDPQIKLETSWPELDLIVPSVSYFLQRTAVSYELDGQTVRGYRSPDNPLLWLRDHVYQGRGFRYIEQDMTSLLDAFRKAQYPDGHFPDVLTYPALGVVAHRMQTESDLEYLFVQGVYEAWQATGDDQWLALNIPAMERGIGYITSDSLRWDSRLGLVRRPYTIDTWDFEIGPSTVNPDDPNKPAPRHWIDEQTIWGIFHGDNTGVAYALRLLERIERMRGNQDAADRWQKQRQGLMEQLNKLSWNGHFYTHFVLPDGTLPKIPGVDTAAQLSLSNAYALNREVLRSSQQQAIISSYYDRRNFGEAFAEWYSINPAFPAGIIGMGGGKGEQPGEYVNGGIMPLVGGELARGAFTAGFATYGFDILQRYAELLRLTGASYLWYHPDGRPGRSGEHTLATDGWGASAMLGALVEGAAGIVDRQSRYRQVTISPNWASLTHKDDTHSQSAYVVARYAASDGYVAYRWQREWEHEQERMRLLITGTWEHAHIRLLLPSHWRRPRTILVNGQPFECATKDIGEGKYLIVDLEGETAEIIIPRPTT